MVPESARDAFITRLTARAVDLTSLALAQGMSEMLDFFEGVRADDCASCDGDMLLFQWGTYDWGTGEHFEVDIARQFIAADLEGDDVISQLHLTYRFAPTSLLRDRGTGNRWCKSLAEISTFKDYIAGHPAIRAVSGMEPVEVALTYEDV